MMAHDGASAASPEWMGPGGAALAENGAIA
ncbi:hypothetical protein BH10ACT3_BH10ACT3_23320 [soil metagenome]